VAVADVPISRHRPALGAIRAQLGLKPLPCPSPEELREEMAAADRWVRVMDQAWVLLECSIAHVMWAYRQSLGSDAAAAFRTEEVLHQWLAERKCDFAGLADELVAEAADHAKP
jgi:hypothetical protein